VLYVLEPGDHRGGVRAARDLRRVDAAARAPVGPPADDRAARPVPGGVRARVRESPVDDPALPRLPVLRIVRAAGSVARDAPATDRRAGDRLRARRVPTVRVEPARPVAGTDPAARPLRRPADVLVRRHEGRLARNDGDERAAIDSCRSTRDVRVRSPAAVRLDRAARAARALAALVARTSPG